MRKFKFVIILLLSFFVLTLASCKPDESGLEYAEGTELKLAVAHNSKATTITFQDSKIVGTGLELADGKTYHMDELKPVWAELEKVLKVEFDNVYKGETSAQKEYLAWKALDFAGVDVVVGNADDMAADGKLGKLVNLADYLDVMPNFKAFLEANPIVYLSVISDVAKGSIYYAPYFDGYNDIEKYFLMRSDWIETLLDGSGDFAATTSDTFGAICGEAAYEPYMQTSGKLEIESLKADGSGTEVITKNYDSTYHNIVDYMNENATAATTGVELVNMLRKYIDAAYNNRYGTKRSELFTGYNAAWDADELVALLRCIVTNTFALTGQNTAKVTGIFPRESSLNRTMDLVSLVSLFGVRGYEARNDDLYFDAQGNLRDARADVEFANGVDKLNSLYQEGLILQDFDLITVPDSSIFKRMYQENLGFMIYDYCQTQTLYNEDATTLAKEPDFNLTPVINPIAKWFDGSNLKNNVDQGTYMRFTESWRSVKTNGWCITAGTKDDKLNAALKMFDFMYSEEGRILISYGPEAWRSGDTSLYKGEEIPELSEAALDELWNLAGGNYTNYARQYLGSTLPIGFIKDQGMEYQCTSQGGKDGAEIVSAAIAHGVLKHVSPFISENLFYTMVPTVLPTTAQQDLLISTYAALGSSGLYRRAKGQYNIYIHILKNGLGSNVKLTNTFITDMPADAEALVSAYAELGGTAYIVVRQSAWEKLENYYHNNLE
ncbi:MAG: hypothetical protein PHX62_01030 [Bacilli bacterium]|nr:hypothetical protein [Bacilli bacterium]